MTRKYFHASAAAVLSGAVLITPAAVSGQAQQPQSPPTSQSKTTGTQPTTTLSGCVYQEKDVPGRAPNPAERAGILEDYILTNVTPGKSDKSATGTSGAVGTTGTAKSGTMYKLEHADDEKLKAVVGKRVEVTGRIDAEASDKTGTSAAPPTSSTDRAVGRDTINLPEFEITSIREVSGTCPAKPSAP